MRDFRKQLSRTHEVFNFAALCAGFILVLAFAAFAGHAAWGMYTKFVVASRGDEAAQKELAGLNTQYAKMSAAVGNLSTARGEEGEMRERFGVALPGEGAIQIVRSATSSDGAADTIKVSLWSRILHALFVW